IPVHLTSTVSRIVGLLPGKVRTNPVPPSIRFDTAIGEGLTPAGASRDQRLALVRRHPLLRCDRHQTKLIPVGSSSPSRVSQSLEEIDALLEVPASHDPAFWIDGQKPVAGRQA